MLKASGILIGALLMGAAFAQSPSQTPAVTPSQTPNVDTPSAPVVGGPPPAIVGLSPCENLIGLERDSCLKDERARVGDAGGRAAGAGGTHAPGSTGTGHGTMGAQNTAPAGSTR
jgi:hypothetical protein